MNMTMMRAVLLCGTAMCVAGPAMAQDQSPAGAPASQTAPKAAGAQLEEVVVTARKTSEALQTTPVAVTALNANALRAAQITTVADLQKASPALSVSTGGPGGNGTAYYSIRGQSNQSGNSTQDAPVATYVDGVYYARSIMGNLGIFDLSQAEVLRGPQGTLFGRNTTGGALNLTTTQPGGEFGGYVSAEYGNFNSVVTDGAVTVPLQGDALSLRLAGRYASHDNYFSDPIDGSGVAKLNHFWSLRGTLKWAPENLPLTLSVSADTTDWADTGQPTALVAYDPTTIGFLFGPATANAQTAFLVGPGGGGRFNESYQAFFPTPYPQLNSAGDSGRSGGVSATLGVNLGPWNLKSITAWRYNHGQNTLDLDGTPLPLLYFYTPTRQKQYSEEIQASTTIGNLDLIAGAMYFYEEGTEQSLFSNPSPTNPFRIGHDNSSYDSKSSSIYAQANYRFTDRLRGTAGYRYTWDERNVTRMGLSDAADPTACSDLIPLTPGGCSLPLSKTFNYPAWLLGLDYKLTDHAFLYVKASQASLSGGFNTRESPAGREAFNPEQRREVEIGVKVDGFDRRVRANLAIFSGETKDAQRQAAGIRSGGTGTTQFTQNNGDVESSGAELELTVLPWEGMKVQAGVGYLDASYKKGSFVEQSAPGVFTDRSGEVVPLSPEWSFNVGATQTWNTSYGDLIGHLDYVYFDDKAVQQATAAPGSSAGVVAAYAIANQVGTLPSHSLVNGKVSLRTSNGLEFSIWGTNLTDEKYYNSAFPALYVPLGVGVRNQGDPRTFGIGVRYDF